MSRGEQRRPALGLPRGIWAAVNASGLSRYRIAKELEIAESTMSRFMSGHAGLSMEYLDRLADLLGLHITVEPEPKAGKDR